MKNLILFIIVILALVLVQFAQAKSADEIIDKHLIARGGRDALRNLKTLIMQGAKNLLGNEVLVQIIKVQGKLFRTDYRFNNTPGLLVVTDSKASGYFPWKSSFPEEFHGERLKQLQVELDIAGPLLDYSTKGHKVELKGKELLKERNCYQIKMTLNTGKQITYFIDSKTYVLQQSRTFITNENGQRVEEVTEFSDWSKIEDIYFPQSINVISDHMHAGLTTINQVIINPDIPANIYNS